MTEHPTPQVRKFGAGGLIVLLRDEPPGQIAACIASVQADEGLTLCGSPRAVFVELMSLRDAIDAATDALLEIKQ